jgi:hypothetical protein
MMVVLRPQIPEEVEEVLALAVLVQPEEVQEVLVL